MLKVVVDTNVLVSALLKPDSVPELVLSLVLSGEIVLCLSEPIAISIRPTGCAGGQIGRKIHFV
jgi:predicted nucleic acid-binding protein